MACARLPRYLYLFHLLFLSNFINNLRRLIIKGFEFIPSTDIWCSLCVWHCSRLKGEQIKTESCSYGAYHLAYYNLVISTQKEMRVWQLWECVSTLDRETRDNCSKEVAFKQVAKAWNKIEFGMFTLHREGQYSCSGENDESWERGRAHTRGLYGKKLEFKLNRMETTKQLWSEEEHDLVDILEGFFLLPREEWAFGR